MISCFAAAHQLIIFPSSPRASPRACGSLDLICCRICFHMASWGLRSGRSTSMSVWVTGGSDVESSANGRRTLKVSSSRASSSTLEAPENCHLYSGVRC